MESTNIYFIGSVELGAVKIGLSNNPEKRLAELQTGNPYKLVLFGCVTDVTPDYEKRLHRVMDHIRLEGEWFKLTDELLHFMVNKTDETSYEFKTVNPVIESVAEPKQDLIDIAIDSLVELDMDGKAWLSETRLINAIKEWLVFKGENPHFDPKKLKNKMENKGIYRTKEGDWGYMDHKLNFKNAYPPHYLGSVKEIWNIYKWNGKWENKLEEDSTRWNKIKVSLGYSDLVNYDNGHIGAVPKTYFENNDRSCYYRKAVVIYRSGVYLVDKNATMDIWMG